MTFKAQTPPSRVEHIDPASHIMRRGEVLELRGTDPTSDFHFVERDDPEGIADTLVKVVQNRIPERFHLDPIRDVQILCPMNRGSLSVRGLNMALQRVLNPVRTGEPAVERYGWRFQKGDKVIQTENTHDDNEPMIEVDPVVENLRQAFAELRRREQEKAVRCAASRT